MAEQEYPTLNGVEPSWADVGFQFPVYGGAIWKPGPAIAGFDWDDALEPGKAPGANGGRPWRRTRGDYSANAKATFYQSGWRSFRQELVKKSRRIGLVGFDVIIQHTPPEEMADDGIYTVKLIGCRITARAGSNKEGTDPNKIEITLNPMRIEEIDPGETEGVSLI